MASIRLSLLCRPHEVLGGNLRACLDVARIADSAGFHSIHFGEHVLMGSRTDRYPYGSFAHAHETPWLEPFTTLGAMAAVTGRIRLSTGVLLTPLRPAALLAKSVATLDVLSSGRAELGVGTGWQREEYAAVGVPWAGRNQRMDDTIEACRALWGEQPVTFSNAVLTVEGVRAFPVPVQRRVPLIYGVAMTTANAQRIAAFGDGWVPVNLGPDEVREGVELLSAAWAKAGRGDTAIVRAQPKPVLDDRGVTHIERTLESAPEFVAAGATVISVGLPAALRTMADIGDFLERAAVAARG